MTEEGERKKSVPGSAGKNRATHFFKSIHLHIAGHLPGGLMAGNTVAHNLTSCAVLQKEKVS